MKNEIINRASEIIKKLEQEHGSQRFTTKEYMKSMNRMNKRMKVAKEKYKRKEANSWYKLWKLIID